MSRIPQYEQLIKEHKEFIQTSNKPSEKFNGIVQRYMNPELQLLIPPCTGDMILMLKQTHMDWKELV